MAASRSSKPASLTVTILAATAVLAAGSYLYTSYMRSNSCGSGLKGYSNPGAPKHIPAEKELESDKKDAGESGPVEKWDMATLRKWLEKVSCLLLFRTEASVCMCNNNDMGM